VSAAEFDVFHGWGARAWELTSLAGCMRRRPTVGTLHDHPHADYMTARRQKLLRWCARFGLDQVTVVSHALREACLNASWPAQKLAVIHNGLPAPTEPPAVRNASGRLRLGFLGSLSEGKGLRDLLAAVAELEQRAAGRWELQVAGTAQDAAGEALKGKLARACSAAPWWSRVHWRGWVRAEEFLREIDVLVFPSRAFETFGLAPAEAALAGVPTVAARVGAVPEVVVDGESGWLFEPGDAPGCATLLQRLVQKPELLAAASAAARAHVSASFPAGKMVAAYAAVYSALTRDGR
jgi:glycosyltransferase involved in cell wall biosynthesis